MNGDLRVKASITVLLRSIRGEASERFARSRRTFYTSSAWKKRSLKKTSKPEQSSTQMGLQLDATLTIQTKKRFLSSKPDEVQGNGKLVAARADTATESEDVSRPNNTSPSQEQLLFAHMIPSLVTLPGIRFQIYEFQISKEATRQCRDEDRALQAALWCSYKNQEHRTKHQVESLSISNQSSSSGGNSELAAFKREIAESRKGDCKPQKYHTVATSPTATVRA